MIPKLKELWADIQFFLVIGMFVALILAPTVIVTKFVIELIPHLRISFVP